MHILILGGTTEANELAALLAQQPQLRATLSLAGRTRNPVLPDIACRIGGFGGVDGLVQWIRTNHVTALVDATHPFASIMPFHAAEASAQTGIPMLALTRPEWMPETGDNWTQAVSHGKAITILGENPRRIFLTVGRLELDAYAAAPHHFYIVRTIDPVDPKPLLNALWMTGRGPFTMESELSILSEHKVEILITKNSGGIATKAKLLAARKLGFPAVLIARPPKPTVETVHQTSAAMQWIHKLSL